MKAVAYDIDNDLNEIPVCTIVFDGKSVTFEGKHGTVQLLQRVLYGDREYTPKDGEEYMKILSSAFQGSRFFVTLEERG